MRRQNFQTLSWFYDIYNRELLELNPPYQRRSVWNQEYKDFFIDTILQNYPAPAIFLYEEINANGIAKYNVVDGKQRISTIIEFLENKFPVYEKAAITELRGKYFEELSKDEKIKIWNYSFLVEYLPTSEETMINNIFDRINRNVAKLTSQELRHARFSGAFITTAEELTDYMNEKFNNSFPRIASQSKKQMKDVELVSQVLLLIEEGPKGYSSDELDIEFSKRETDWDKKDKVTALFIDAINLINQIFQIDTTNEIQTSRFCNQADFYSLVGAIVNELIKGKVKTPTDYVTKLKEFNHLMDDDEIRKGRLDLESYYQNARVASNRTSARSDRINVLEAFLNP
ncbi:MAG: DUF262 domain-containing protein [Bacteroidia bacterium]